VIPATFLTSTGYLGHFYLQVMVAANARAIVQDVAAVLEQFALQNMVGVDCLFVAKQAYSAISRKDEPLKVLARKE